MTPKQALNDLADFFSDKPVLEATTVAGPSGSSSLPEVRTLNLADDAEAFFRSVVATSVIDKIDSWSPKKFAPLYKPDPDEIEWLDPAHIDAVKLAVSRYDNLSPFAPFDPAEDAYKKRLQYWVVVLTHRDSRKAFFFRAFSVSAELQRRRGAALVSRKGTFHKAEDHIFLFDNVVDCFVFGDCLFVIRKRDYRRIFDQMDAIKRRAKSAASDLHQRVPIANFDDFAKACATDSRMADKILAVRQRDYFSQLSYQMLRSVIDEFNLAIPTKTVNGEIQLVFRTEPDQRFRILKLVDDDYLNSTMTKHHYEVNSKTESPNG